MTYLKVKGHDGLVRDISNGAIINTNNAEYDRYTSLASRIFKVLL